LLRVSAGGGGGGEGYGVVEGREKVPTKKCQSNVLLTL